MSLSLTAELRARVSTPPPFLAPTTPGAELSVFRRTFRPGGNGAASYTLTLFDSGAPHPEGGSWLGYRLHRHDPGGPRRGTLLFAGADQPPPREEEGGDLTMAARDVLERLTRVPGDSAPDPTDAYSPEQLAFALREARQLREAVRQRLGWRPEVPFNPRADLGELGLAHHTSRALSKGGRRHRARVGIVEAEGPTRRAAAEALFRAIGNHCSAEPDFWVGPHSGNVYCLLPAGALWAVHCVTRDGVVTKPAMFEASSFDSAQRSFESAIQRLEATYGPPRRRVSVRAA